MTITQQILHALHDTMRAALGPNTARYELRIQDDEYEPYTWIFLTDNHRLTAPPYDDDTAPNILIRISNESRLEICERSADWVFMSRFGVPTGPHPGEDETKVGFDIGHTDLEELGATLVREFTTWNRWACLAQRIRCWQRGLIRPYDPRYC